MISEQIDAEFHEVANEIAKNSPYQRKESEERTMMTVHEMGDLLGIKKTDRYWLLHKGFFKTKVVLGKTWIDIASFEKWYANQVKYKKVNGEEPGKELKAWSYSPQELAQELGVTDSAARLNGRMILFFFLVVGSSSSSSVELSAASSFTMFVKVMLPSVFCRDISTLPSPLISYAKLSKFRALPFASVSSTINVVLDSFASIGTVILTVSFCFNCTT